MRNLTKLEAHFLSALRESVRRSRQHTGLYLLYPTEGPDLLLAVQTVGAGLVYVRVLIYGSRPVRYCFETRAAPTAGRLKALWDDSLGALSLVVERSGVRRGRLLFYYQVSYPESFLRSLGE